MPFDINQYLQRGLVYGGARTSKFDVNLTIPTNVLSSDSATIDPASQDKLTFTCVAASIPSFQIGEVQLPYFGRKIKSAGDRVWSNWRISVQIDEDYATRAMFEAWNNALNRIESNVLQGNLANESYKASWFITHYGRDNSIIRKYEVIGGWPKTVGPITLDWAGTDKVSEFEVEVCFDNFIPTPDGEQTSKSSSTVYGPSVDALN